MRKPELLAPAGNREAFEAALGAGADAIYLGAGSFNARRNADNFSPEDLKAACRDAHLRGAKVYLTANTLVFPGEMKDALAMVADACEAGIDAAIVQDLGLMSVLARELPALELHASTQMNIRDERGVEIARKLGCTRVTLARELSIKRIAKLAKRGMDLEVFVHGALCICQSGQCLFSSLIGGRSANRGLCAQPCRLPYEMVDEAGRKLSHDGSYLLSPRDLAGIDLLPQLIEANVASLKVEGRMKLPEYVSTVTGIYREAIDRAWMEEDVFAATEDEKAQLAEAFTRGFTQGYLAGERGNEMMGYKRPNNRGIAVGRVAGFSAGKVKINATTQIAEGDLLEFWTSKGRATYSVSSGDKVRGNVAFLAVKDPVSVGDRVFRVRSSALTRASQMRTKSGLQIPIAIFVRAVEGEPLVVRISDEHGHTGQAEGPVIEAARTKAITREDVIEHVGRLGATPYVCENWDVELGESVGAGFSMLHKTRAAAISVFENDVLEDNAPERSQGKGLDLGAVVDMSEMSPFATAIDFEDTTIAVDLGSFETGRAIGPKLYATNLEALQTWAALGADFAWLSPELTLHQIKLLADESPIPLGLVVHGRQELMVSDHCFLMAQGPCDEHCAQCKRRSNKVFLEDRKGYRFPVTTDSQGRGHIYNAVPLDVVHAVRDLLNAGVRGFAVDCTHEDSGVVEYEMNRLRSALNGKKVEKEPDTTTGHLFRAVQ